MKPSDILSLLRENRNAYFSGEEISRKLKVSRSAVWKDIQALRKLGYDIEAQPHLGYRLAAIPDRMFSDELAHGLPNQLIGRQIFSYESLDSTNDSAFHLGEQGIREGACVFAEYQKKGRGRLGRHWVSPKGKNLILSVLLRPVLLPQEVSRLTLACAVSVIRTIRKTTGKMLGIKWPNDIYHSDKKVGGILTEMSAESDRINFIVVGIGVNINSHLSELPQGSTSLKEVLGHEINRLDFARTLLVELESDYLRLKGREFESLAKDWEDFSITSGQRVMAKLFDQKIEGQAVGIDRDGALWIRQDNGLQQRIVAGDIEHLWADKK